MRSVEHFSVGDILKTGVGAYLKNLRTFAPLTLIASLPTMAAFWAWDSASADVVATLSVFWLNAALTYGVIGTLRGEDVSLTDSFWHGSRAFMTVLLVVLAIVVVVLAGCVALIVPGILLAMMLYVAVPVAIIERVGVFEALRRSCELTKDYKGEIFKLNLAINVVLLGLAAPVLLGGFEHESVWLLLAEFPLCAIIVAIDAVVYHDLRVIKEGIDTTAVAKVFD